MYVILIYMALMYVDLVYSTLYINVQPTTECTVCTDEPAIECTVGNWQCRTR